MTYRVIDRKFKTVHMGTNDPVTAFVYTNNDGDMCLDYRHQGMSYTQRPNMYQLIKMGLVKCDCSNVLPVLGFENEIVGEECQACGKLI